MLRKPTLEKIFMSWIINFFLMKLMKILFKMELSSPILVSPSDRCSWDDNSGLAVFTSTMKNRDILQDHPSFNFSTELASETPSSSIRPLVGAFCAL